MSGVNGMRGEVSVVLAGEARRLCLTLGALAEIETGLQVSGLAGLAERMRALSAGTLLVVLAALLRGGGERELAEGLADAAESARWIERESKLRHIILTPSLVIVWLLGLALAHVIGAWSEGWFHAKLTLVVILSAYHGWMIGYAKRLARGGSNLLTGKQLRLINEVPGLATIGIVILVIVKPF